jgi:hypothetical protein
MFPRMVQLLTITVAVLAIVSSRSSTQVDRCHHSTVGSVGDEHCCLAFGYERDQVEQVSHALTLPNNARQGTDVFPSLVVV